MDQLGKGTDVLSHLLRRQGDQYDYEFFASQKCEQVKVRQFVNTSLLCFEDFTFIYSLFQLFDSEVLGCLDFNHRLPIVALMGM